MLSILAKDPQSINGSNRWGQTPLHLAVGWLFGVNVLIEHGANLDSRDIYKATPLSHALAHGFAETVGLLMKAGCSLDQCFSQDPLEKAIFQCVKPSRYFWGDASMQRHETTLETFIISFAQRRRQLSKNLAAASIPKGIKACWDHNDRVLDEHARCAEDALKYYGTAASQASVCFRDLRSVYHIVLLTTEIAKKLWQAGFHDVDVSDEYYKTPLTKQRSYFSEIPFDSVEKEVELIVWLVERGANLYSPMRYFDSHSKLELDFKTLHPEQKALHYIAANIARLIYSENGPRTNKTESYILLLSGCTEFMGESSTQILATIFSNPSPDGCLCACSSGGCTTSTILQKKLAKIGSLQATRYLMILIGQKHTYEDWLIDEIIRFNTFQELELKHTCCQHKDGFFTELEPEEIAEFWNEDFEGIKLLEELMAEFQDKRGTQSVVEFLEGYWTRRMEEVHRTRGKVDLKKSREMGIVWSESESDLA